jgi:ATP synthase protein I
LGAPMAKENEPDETTLHNRLEKLSSAIEAQRTRSPSQTERDAADLAGKSAGQAMNLGFRVLTELVASVVVGALIGWQFDEWFKTSPFLLILFLMFGIAAGFWNVYRIAVPPDRNRKRGAGSTDQDRRGNE